MSILWHADELPLAVGAAGPGFAASGVSIDTRSLQPGDLFVALQADRDGHDFIPAAFAKGAAGALVSRDVDTAPVLRVDDTLAALHRLGAAARARTGAKIIAVTGSVGKTTTKEMLRRALSAFGTVHAADASFNNHIGVPLTLARMPAVADFAVLEIGMNHPGEIFPLTQLARPHVALITNIGRAHIGLMGSEAAIAAEKAEIFAGLAPGGVAVLPAETPHGAILRDKIPNGARMMTFGAAALLALTNSAADANITANIAGVTVKFRLAAPGHHMAMNALAVLTACAALGLDVTQAAAALDGFAPVAGRGARRAFALRGGTATLLDESYNASAASIRAALSVLALQPGRRVAVLGDMLELGDDAESEHVLLRDDVAAAADIVFCAGPMMGALFNALPDSRRGAWATDAATLAPSVKDALHPGDTVLVKGSYGSRMRDVVAHLEGAA
jgi:UDP-N-acetylmuramoyl-tripeptide--D-alanyl-D-alanine ligase